MAEEAPQPPASVPASMPLGAAVLVLAAVNAALVAWVAGSARKACRAQADSGT